MHWEKVREKVMTWAQPGSCGQNEMCELAILKEGALVNCWWEVKVTGSEAVKELKAQGVRLGFSTVIHRQAMVVKSLGWRRKL